MKCDWHNDCGDYSDEDTGCGMIIILLIYMNLRKKCIYNQEDHKTSPSSLRAICTLRM